MNVNVRALIETKLATWLKKFLSSKPVVHVLVIDIKLRNEWDVSGLLEVLLRNTAQGFLYARTMILRYWNFTDPCGQEGKSLDQRTDAATGWYQIWGSQPSKAVFLLFFPLWCQLFEIPVGCFPCTWSISWMKCKKKTLLSWANRWHLHQSTCYKMEVSFLYVPFKGLLLFNPCLGSLQYNCWYIVLLSIVLCKPLIGLRNFWKTKSQQDFRRWTHHVMSLWPL